MLQTPNSPPADLALVYLPTRKGEDKGVLGVWSDHYSRSGNTAMPTLITIPTVLVPAFWPYRVIRPVVRVPSVHWTAAYRTIWLKLQAYRLLGRCVVLDADAYPIDYIGGLAAVTAPIAMPPGPVVDIGMPEPVAPLSTGVMLIDSPDFEKIYLEYYARYDGSQAARHPAYAEQCASLAHAKLGGSVLNAGYNGDPADPGRSRILHCRTDPQICAPGLGHAPVPWMTENHQALVTNREDVS